MKSVSTRFSLLAHSSMSRARPCAWRSRRPGCCRSCRWARTRRGRRPVPACLARTSCGVGRHVVHDLGHEAPPVDGVRARQRHAVGVLQLFREGLVAEHVLRRRSGSRRSCRARPTPARCSPRCVTICLHWMSLTPPSGYITPMRTAVHVAEALERGLARVARRGHQDEEVVVELPCSRSAAALAEKNRGRHCSAMSLNALVGPCHSSSTWVSARERRDGADALVVEVAAVNLRHERIDDLGRQVGVERPVDARRALGVGQVRPAPDVLQRKLRDTLGHVQPAARRQPVDDGFRERDRTGPLRPACRCRGSEPCPALSARIPNA